MGTTESASEIVAEGDADQLRRYLAGREVACPQCGYNLRDLAGDRCPECGDQLVLRVNMAEPRLAAPITGLVGLSAGAGLNGLLLIYGMAVLLWIRPGMPAGLDAFFRCNLAGFFVEGLALYLWLRSWRKVRRLGASRRWLLALGCWALTGANLTVFTLYVK